MTSTRVSTQRAAALAVTIAKHSTLSANTIAAHVTHLQRITKQLHAIAERQCNGYQTWDHKWDPVAAKLDEDRERRLEQRAKDIANALGEDFGIATNGDPRGAVLRLLIKGERGDGWDDGFAVY